MSSKLRASARHLLRALLYGTLGALLVGIAVAVHVLESRPDLSAWHTVHLDAEFTEDSSIETFADYLALEERVYAQLEAEVYRRAGSPDWREIDRYSEGSLADPRRWPRNWNRTFELTQERPVSGVLLVHGMSDSPYSMRSLAEQLHEAGAHVVGLRVPGHGTAPSGLVRTTWQDMAAAVRIAAMHVRNQVPDRPFFVVGYSNGGALSVMYTLEALERAELALPDGLVLLSPEIGITPLAALAAWQERLGHVLGLRKLAWRSILPEYDAFKYGSFALNAGKQAYLITQAIQARIAALGEAGALGRFPPVLAFQSVVDATVSSPALVTGLFEPLPANGHELVLFDINRVGRIEPVLTKDPDAWLREILTDAGTSFTVSVVTNVDDESLEVVLRQRHEGESPVTETKLDMRWPLGIYSLSHVALPFAPDDPHYGGPDAAPGPGLQLGNLALRGERGVLQVSAAEMLRLRWNPFYPYVAERTLERVVGAPATRR